MIKLSFDYKIVRVFIRVGASRSGHEGVRWRRAVAVSVPRVGVLRSSRRVSHPVARWILHVNRLEPVADGIAGRWPKVGVRVIAGGRSVVWRDVLRCVWLHRDGQAGAQRTHVTAAGRRQPEYIRVQTTAAVSMVSKWTCIYIPRLKKWKKCIVKRISFTPEAHKRSSVGSCISGHIGSWRKVTYSCMVPGDKNIAPNELKNVDFVVEWKRISESKYSRFSHISPTTWLDFLMPYGVSEIDCLNRLNVIQTQSAVQWQLCFRFFLPFFYTTCQKVFSGLNMKNLLHEKFYRLWRIKWTC